MTSSSTFCWASDGYSAGAAAVPSVVSDTLLTRIVDPGEKGPTNTTAEFVPETLCIVIDTGGTETDVLEANKLLSMKNAAPLLSDMFDTLRTMLEALGFAFRTAPRSNTITVPVPCAATFIISTEVHDALMVVLTPAGNVVSTNVHGDGRHTSPAAPGRQLHVAVLSIPLLVHDEDGVISGV